MPIRWNSEPLLGKISDEELARKYGVNVTVVRHARCRRKIISLHTADSTERKILNMLSNSDPINILLLADCVDLPRHEFMEAWKSLRSKGYIREKSEGFVRARRKEYMDWSCLPLGKMSDMKVASVIGVSLSAVRKARIRRGIPAFHNHDPKGLKFSVVEAIKMGKRSTKPITEFVRNDYGKISERQVIRTLNNLCKNGKLAPDRTGYRHEWGYILI